MNFESVKSFVSQNWVGTAVGVVVALYTYLRSKRRVCLQWRYYGVALVGHAHAQLGAKLSISYDGSPLPRASLTKLFVWNSGTETIRREDMAANDRLRIEMQKDARVLGAVVEKSVREVNAVSCSGSPSENTVVVEFDFLDPGDGAVVAILHTGEQLRPSLHGTIKGMRRGLSGGDALLVLPRGAMMTGTYGVFIAVYVGAVGALMIAAPFASSFALTALGSAVRWTAAGLGAFLVVAALAIPFVYRERFPRELAEPGSFWDTMRQISSPRSSKV